MNRPIRRLFVFFVLLFAVLIVFTSRWTVFQAASLRDNPLNARRLLEQEHVPRGPIVASDGTVLARSVRGREGVYTRVYPTGELFAFPVGYHFTDLGSSGIELYQEAALSGHSSEGLQSLLDQLQGIEPVGEKVVTTLVPRAQRVAMSSLAPYHGAVVALDPRTGAVEVMASHPAYNPNSLNDPREYRRLSTDNATTPLVNRATQFGYAPGSTFKIVTATAAINSGLYTPESLVNGRDGIIVSGVPLHNDYDQSYGDLTLTQALAKSVNTVWAQVAEHVGKPRMQAYMERFGFDEKPHLDYPAEEMSASGEYEGERIVPATSPFVDLGRLGIGQDKMQATAMQMVQVAAAVANHGVLMRPYLTARIVNHEGQVVATTQPNVQANVMKRSTANDITGMMEAVVNEGTGTPAQIPGVQVAGKTGTAETVTVNSVNNAWFIAFAPARDPKVAVAVTVQKVPGYGATYAAPIARRVIESLLR
ncbi:MAG TPA: penicillin-binding protein 2 [Solirubrobacteraceae bacterium]|nr:penicillin-binding protein 2 [Solirubrobacteraceae bacterium]